MDLIIISQGRIYRERDLHLRAPNGRIAIITHGSRCVEVIEAGENQQRRSQPVKYDTMLKALNSMTGANIKKIEHYRILTKDGHRMRVA